MITKFPQRTKDGGFCHKRTWDHTDDRRPVS